MILLICTMAWLRWPRSSVVLNAFRPDKAMWLVPLAMIALGALAGLVPAFKAYRTDVASNLTPLS